MREVLNGVIEVWGKGIEVNLESESREVGKTGSRKVRKSESCYTALHGVRCRRGTKISALLIANGERLITNKESTEGGTRIYLSGSGIYFLSTRQLDEGCHGSY